MKTKPALVRRVANLAELRAMSREDMRARTCPVCEATFREIEDRDECLAWHRK